MTIQQLKQTLLEIPETIRKVEQEILLLEERRRQQEFAIEELKSRLLTQEDGPIQGKNAEVRAAQLQTYVLPQSILLADTVREIDAKKVDLRYWRLLHQSNSAISQLLAARLDLFVENEYNGLKIFPGFRDGETIEVPK